MELIMTPVCRAARLFALALLLHDPHNVAQLAVKLKVHRRTIQRDLVLLQAEPLGLPIFEPCDQYYQLDPDWVTKRHI